MGRFGFLSNFCFRATARSIATSGTSPTFKSHNNDFGRVRFLALVRLRKELDRCARMPRHGAQIVQNRSEHHRCTSGYPRQGRTGIAPRSPRLGYNSLTVHCIDPWLESAASEPYLLASVILTGRWLNRFGWLYPLIVPYCRRCGAPGATNRLCIVCRDERRREGRDVWACLALFIIIVAAVTGLAAVVRNHRGSGLRQLLGCASCQNILGVAVILAKPLG
jgi:hypothetical protein